MKKLLLTALAFAGCGLTAGELPHAELWARYLDRPDGYRFEPKLERQTIYDRGDFTIETYLQANGPGTVQRTFLALPKDLKEKVPAVVVPFYFPEAMLGFDPATGTNLANYAECSFMKDLVKRGYAVISADAYHRTYATATAPADNWAKWKHVGEALKKDWPSWTGIGKLVADTRLLVDMLCADSRVDSARIGIMGHSLGGKMAFYTGLLDPRVKAVVASDFGYDWDRSNWSDVWYWGDKLKEARAAGLSHLDLMLADPSKPVCFLLGEYDGGDSVTRGLFHNRKAIPRMSTHRRYVSSPRHRPSAYAIAEAYAFLDEYVKEQGRPRESRWENRVRILKPGDVIAGRVCKCFRIPGIVVAPDGAILVVADARFWNHNDLYCGPNSGQPIRTVYRRSTDGGRTWSEPALVCDPPWNDAEKWSYSDPSLLVDYRAGKVFCFANVMEFVKGEKAFRVFVCQSEDSGRTWASPREITDDIRWPGVTPLTPLNFVPSGHGIQKRDGTILHCVLAARNGLNLFGSKNHGVTWGPVGKPLRVFDESKVVELADGSLLVNARFAWQRRTGRSGDGGETWKVIDDMNLPDSRTNGAIAVVPWKGGEALVFSNSSRAVRPRQHLTVRGSTDGGRSWNRGVLIEPRCCSYSDVTYLPEGRVGVIFEAEGEEYIDFISLPLEKIMAD